MMISETKDDKIEEKRTASEWYNSLSDTDKFANRVNHAVASFRAKDAEITFCEYLDLSTFSVS